MNVTSQVDNIYRSNCSTYDHPLYNMWTTEGEIAFVGLEQGDRTGFSTLELKSP